MGKQNMRTACPKDKLEFKTFIKPWGSFLQSPDNFSGLKSNIQIEIKRIRAQVLASKILHFSFFH